MKDLMIRASEYEIEGRRLVVTLEECIWKKRGDVKEARMKVE